MRVACPVKQGIPKYEVRGTKYGVRSTKALRKTRTILLF